MRRLFDRFIVPPDDVDARSYYNCLSGGSLSGCGEPASFDPVGLAAAINAQVTVPRREAQAFVNRHGYLTRLYTRMDAADMTIDPIFRPDSGLGDTSNVHRATRVTECTDEYFEEDAPARWEIEGAAFPGRLGEITTDRAYCREIGGVPRAPVRPTRPRSSGCQSVASGAGAVQGGGLAAMLLVLFVRRRLRERRR